MTRRLKDANDAIILAKQWALHCDLTYHQHVNHGYFWDRTAEFGKFLYEAWVSPETGAEYLISDGYGGAHNLLWGFGGFSSGYGSMTGNITLDAVAASFSSIDGIYAGDWHHVAVGWDGNYIYTWVDGVISKRVAATGVRKTSGDISEGGLFIGGSNHSNYAGYIRMIRGIEGYFPLLPASYVPEANFRNAFLFGPGSRQSGCHFLADYSTPASIVEDISDGFSNGVRQVMSTTVAGSVTGTGNLKGVVTANGMGSSPKTVTAAVTNGWTASQAAAALRTAYAADADVNKFFIVSGSGAVITLTAIEPSENDSTMNFTVENDTSTGITDDTTATSVTKGYRGQLVRHPGILASEQDGGLVGGFVPARSSGYIENLPEFRIFPFTQPTTFRGTQLSIPGGAVVYDDFSKANVTWAWNDTLTPGVARTAQVPTVPQSDVGIIDGCAYPAGTDSGIGLFGLGYGHCLYERASTTQDVRITKKSTADAGAYAIILRYTDNNNYILWSASVGDYGSIYEKVAGSVSALGANFNLGAWSSVRLTVSGTTVNIYINGGGSPVETRTTSIVAGTKAGFGVGGYGRVEEVAIY
jgi:hypothetical protein